MTREEILELARECGMWGKLEHHSSYVLFAELVAFTRRVQEWEREECAALCDEYAEQAYNSSSSNTAIELRDTIRNRTV